MRGAGAERAAEAPRAVTDAPPTRSRAGVAPVPLVDRIFAIDVLRGVAVLGILVINIEDLGLPHADKTAPRTEWVGAFLPSDLLLNSQTAIDAMLVPKSPWSGAVV